MVSFRFDCSRSAFEHTTTKRTPNVLVEPSALWISWKLLPVTGNLIVIGTRQKKEGATFIKEYREDFGRTDATRTTKTTCSGFVCKQVVIGLKAILLECRTQARMEVEMFQNDGEASVPSTAEARLSETEGTTPTPPGTERQDQDLMRL